MSQVEEATIPQSPVLSPARAEHESEGSLGWIIVAVAVLVIAYAPLVVLHMLHLLDMVQYGFFPLLPVGAYLIARQRLQGIGQVKPGAPWLCGLGLLVCFLLTAFAVAIFSPWVGAVSFLLMLLCCAYGVGGSSFVGRVFPAWLLLCFAIPLPFNLDQELIQWLQTVTAKWSSGLLDTVGVLHAMNGNTVEIPGHKLFVEEACSGVRSLFVILAFTYFFVVYFHHPKIRGAILLASSIVWVLISNSLRVVATTWLTERGYQATEGWPHEMLGIAVFIFALCMLVSFDRLLLFFLPPKAWGKREPLRATGSGIRWPNWGNTWFASAWISPVVAAFALLALTEGYLLVASEPAAYVFREAKPAFDKISADSLDAKWHDWERVDYQTTSRPSFLAQLSRYWTYKSGGSKATVSVDYPFYDWHDLLVCYKLTGWRTVSEDLQKPTEKGKSPWFEVELDNPQLSHGYLFFYLFDQDGKPLEAPTGTIWDRLLYRIGNVRQNWFTASRQLAGNVDDYYQFQVFVETYAPLNDAQLKELREFYQYASGELRTKWLPGSGESTPVQQPATTK